MFDNFAEVFTQIICILTLLGLILYLPLRPHWSKIFSFWNAILLYCGILLPIVIFVLCKSDSGLWTTGDIILNVIGGGVFAIAGLVSLLSCWGRCSNVIEAVFLPIIMLSMVGVFCLGLLSLALCMFSITRRPFFVWDLYD